MTLATGIEVYNTDTAPVTARGVSYTAGELDAALRGSVSRILWDDVGMDRLQAILSSVVTTQFADQGVKRILASIPKMQNWRVGEALAEAFLAEHRSCEFPCPSSRDLKNPAASPAGADLVGFHETDATVNPHRFAFGEVKTSEEEAWPPSAMDGRHGLKRQLEELRDSDDAKQALVRYLGHHADGRHWLPHYHSAVCRYLQCSSDVALFGILVRDVEPRREDMASCAAALASCCSSSITIELRAMYLPRHSIGMLAQRAETLRQGGGGHGQNRNHRE